MSKSKKSKKSKTARARGGFRLPPHEYKFVVSTLSQKQGWGIKQCKIPSTWTVTAGEGETVMVIDTGWSNHVDLGKNSVKGICTVDGSTIADNEGHGCVSPDSIVYTENLGLLKIKDLYNKYKVIEEDVILENSITKRKNISNFNIYTLSIDKSGNINKNRITHLYKSYIDTDIINCKLTRNIEYNLTPWHKIPVYNNNKIVLKRADELTNKDRFIYPEDSANLLNKSYLLYNGQEYYKCNNCGKVVNKKKERTSRCQCKLCGKSTWDVIKSSHLIDEDISYLCGVIITDGHITFNKHKQYRVEISSETDEILNKCKHIIENKNFGSVKIDNTKTNAKRLRVDSKDLVHTLLNLGILNKNKTYNQSLPEFVSKSPYGVICSFIAGVIDGDGCISKNNTKNRITGVSSDFIYGMSNLFNLIGISCGVSKSINRSFGGKDINKKYPILNCVFSSIQEDVSKYIKHPIKAERCQILSRQNKGRKISKIKREGYCGYMYDFSVENDNTYFANGHFVSNTHCAGIIAAQNNNSGMVGVAPKAKVIAVKALGDNGSGSFAGIAKALEYAAEIKPTVVSMSLGASSCTKRVEKAIKKLYDMGIPVICAAGNDGAAGVDYPGKYKETIAIAAYNKNGKIADFSAIGEEVDFAAPGVSIYSTYLNNRYSVLSGTSMACPFVAGVVALLISKHKKQEADGGTNDCKTVEEIRQHLLKYTVDKGYVGKDNYWGYGLLDVEKMILAKNDPSLDLPIYEEPKPEPKPEPPKKRKSFWEWFLGLFR